MRCSLIIVLYTALLFNVSKSFSQVPGTYWQQHVDYTMAIDMDVKTYQYKGTQKLVYTNNSPDVLSKVYYHLYPNAFQPGSEMDVRLQNIPDPDARMVNNLGTKETPVYQSRISILKPDEIGYIHVNSLKQNNVDVKHHTIGTILEVTLAEPIKPGAKTTFDMVFEAQVPVQIRRSGRNNKEGVALSMSQWYPKLAEYDTEGWHTDAYISREFYGVWGNFDVKITIDKDYTIGGTGYLQNPNEIGHGYETEKVKRPKGKTLTWHFIAPNVHDFTWAADPNYIHDKLQMPGGPMLHFIYKNNPDIKENWKKLQPKTQELMNYFTKHIGNYPYEQYSVVQGGDGGMEYAMCTLITGERQFKSLVDVTSHELAHNWFQSVLATHEGKHGWMDEGFTDYFETYAIDEVMEHHHKNPLETSYKNYFKLIADGLEQPQTTHADRYIYNRAYSVSAYGKGSIFLEQLKYIIGRENFDNTLKRYYSEWKFKHPKPIDFIRIAEKVSGLHLNWYLTDWTQTTNTIDYGIKTIDGKTITLERIGLIPMPIDLTVTYTDGTTEDFYIPLRMMHGKKPTTATVLDDWAWAYPTYTFSAKKDVTSVAIDPLNKMADINRNNNAIEL